MTNMVTVGLAEKQHGEKYWLHRISHEWDVSYKLLSMGYLTIGWAAYSQSGIESKVTCSKDAAVFESMMETFGEQGTRSRWNLWNFCNFRPDDYVVVPLFDGKFSVFRLKSRAVPVWRIPAIPERFISENEQEIHKGEDGLLYRTGTREVVDLGFAVEVEPVRERLSRYEYADNKLTARMKIRQTNADISDLEPSIKDVLRADAPINLYASVIEELAGKLLESVRQRLTPDKFEMLIRWYFQKIGATRTLRPAKNSSDKSDGADADIVAEFEPLKILFYVQAKLHEDVTSSWAVEQISKYKGQHEDGMSEYTAIPWVITSADSYSDNATKLAAENRVRLITGREFSRMLIDAGITDINRAFE